MSTVSPLTNQLDTRKSTREPMSLLVPPISACKPGSVGCETGISKGKLLSGGRWDCPTASIVPGAVISVTNRPGRHSLFDNGILRGHHGHLPGAIPLTRIPRGSSSCASDAVACPIADFEYRYGKDVAPVAGSCVHHHNVVLNIIMAKLTFVQPFILDVMITCGTNFLVAPPYSFHFSSSGRKAKVSQYGPEAFVRMLLSKSPSETVSK